MSLARGGAQVFLVSWASFALQFVTGVIVVRALGAEGKGTLAVLVTLVGLMAMLAQLGMPAAAIHLHGRGHYSARTLVGGYLPVTLAATALAGLVVALLAPALLGAFFRDGAPPVRLLWIAVALLPPMMVIALSGNLLLGAGDTRSYTLLTSGMALGTLLGTIAMVLAVPLGVAGALFAIVVPQWIGALWSGVRAARLPSRAGAGQGDARAVSGVTGDMLRIGIGHHMGTIGSQAFKRLDNLVLAVLMGTAPVGYYSVALTGYDALLSLPRAISSLLGGEASARTTEGGARLVARSHRIVLLAMTGIALVGAVLAIWAIPLIYGADFARSVAPTQILLAASVAVAAAIVLQTFFLGIGRPAISGRLTLLAGVVNFGLSLLLIPPLGLVGCALATLIAALLSMALHLGWFTRLGGVPARDALVPDAADLATLRSAAGRLAGSRNG